MLTVPRTKARRAASPAGRPSVAPALCCAPRPPACPPRYEAGAPRPRPACHRWGASPKSAAASTTRCHLRGASLKAPLHSLACHCPLSSATGVGSRAGSRSWASEWFGSAAGKGRARLSHFRHPASVKLREFTKTTFGSTRLEPVRQTHSGIAVGRSGVNELRTLVREQPVIAPLRGRAQLT